MPGSWGTVRCQASSAGAASDQSKLSPNVVTWGVGPTLNVNSLTMPKFPPPPPWQAQNRSGAVVGVARTDAPLGRTIWTARRLSIRRPALRIR